ncbi:procathepsin L-like [Condylostylus longicornis]|uniref:procathepsin L-like n=1 Tax=Condylostylus longicornis TaxID=2530218 RepID=UPI00244DC6B7|nr:procathepsin L-like [Condylostylus longicornis]XP_055389412.1 procathepsin L-like [Condylostylus longicornis]
MKIIISVLLTLIVLILLIILFTFTGEPDYSLESRDIEIEWIKYKEKFNKNYEEPDENERRKQLFTKSRNFIKEHNQRYAKGLESYNLGLNKYADLTDQEYIGSVNKHVDETDLSLINDIDDHHDDNGIDEDYGNLNNFINVTDEQKNFISRNTIEYNYSYIDNIPDNVNWVKLGYDNPVLDQGNCGSCYIFSSLSAIEAHYFIKYKTLVQLSHQELLDCSHMYGNYGCDGGYMEDVYTYIMLHGIGLADQNPYLGTDSNQCKQRKPRIYVKKKFYSGKMNELELKEVIARYGPVTSSINAGLDTFKFYKSGLYYDRNCHKGKLEHGVATVGYGITEKNKDYWLIRNSFGPNWGENGYMRIARNRDNHCGLATYYLFPQF